MDQSETEFHNLLVLRKSKLLEIIYDRSGDKNDVKSVEILQVTNQTQRNGK